MKLLFHLMLVLNLSGCATWRAQDTLSSEGFPEKWTEQGQEKTNINLEFVKYEVFHNKKLDKDEMDSSDKKEVFDVFKKIYKSAKLFHTLEAGGTQREMSIQVSITKKSRSSFGMAIFSAFTLFLVPTKRGEQIIVSTRFLNKEGVLVGMVEKSDTVVTWYQLFMGFAAPFMRASNVEREIIEDLTRDSIIEAYSDGYFVDINS